MKVLHILDSLNRGGAETLELDVCRNAEANELDLIFLATGGGDLEADFRTSGAKFVRLQRRLPFDVPLINKIRRIIKTEKIDVVHTHQAVEALHAYFACLGTSTKLVLTFHGFISDLKNRLGLKFLIPRTAANIVVSRGLQKWLRETGGLDTSQKFTVIYNGTDLKRLRPEGKNLRRELGLDENTLLIGMVGNFYRDPRKDQMTFCRALPETFTEMSNLHCIFAGKIETGAEKKFEDCLEFCRAQEISDRVHFLGLRTDIPDILASLDLFVLSSLQEGLPIAVAEAMLTGVPLIVSDIDPLLEASDNGRYAEVFSVQNADDLAKKILKLMKNDKLRKNLAERALEFAETNFSIEAHLKNLKELYRSII